MKQNKQNNTPSMSFLDSMKDAAAGTAERVKDILSECLCLALDTRGEVGHASEAPAEYPTPHRRGGAPGVGRRHNVRLGTRPPESTARIKLQLVKVRVSRLRHPSAVAKDVCHLVLPASSMLWGRAQSHGIRQTPRQLAHRRLDQLYTGPQGWGGQTGLLRSHRLSH